MDKKGVFTVFCRLKKPPCRRLWNSPPLDQLYLIQLQRRRKIDMSTLPVAFSCNRRSQLTGNTAFWGDKKMVRPLKNDPLKLATSRLIVLGVTTETNYTMLGTFIWNNPLIPSFTEIIPKTAFLLLVFRPKRPWWRDLLWRSLWIDCTGDNDRNNKHSYRHLPWFNKSILMGKCENPVIWAVKDVTRSSNGSFGGTPSGSIVLDTMTENSKHSYEQLRFSRS